MHMSVYIIPLAIICGGLKLQNVFDMLVNHYCLHFVSTTLMKPLNRISGICLVNQEK